jgi:hypothetical protein
LPVWKNIRKIIIGFIDEMSSSFISREGNASFIHKLRYHFNKGFTMKRAPSFLFPYSFLSLDFAYFGGYECARLTWCVPAEMTKVGSALPVCRQAEKMEGST